MLEAKLEEAAILKRLLDCAHLSIQYCIVANLAFV